MSGIECGTVLVRDCAAEKRFNVLKDGRLLFDEWFDKGEVLPGERHLYAVRKGGKWNVVQPDGSMFQEWADFVWGMSTGDVCVILVDGSGAEKSGVARMEGGRLLWPDTWYNLIYDFSGGFAMVVVEGRGINYMRPDGTLLSGEWFPEDSSGFYNGSALVHSGSRGDKVNLLLPSGDTKFEEWLDGIEAWPYLMGIQLKGKNSDGNA